MKTLTLLFALSNSHALDTSHLKLPPNFTMEVIAHVTDARELAVASNGDLLVGTLGGDVMIVKDAEGSPQAAHVFLHVGDAPANGVALTPDSLIVGTQFGVWKLPYKPGDNKASAFPTKIAQVRTKGGSHGHGTTTVAVANGHLFASVGSSCDVCDPELDPTRATVQEMDMDGSHMKPRAIHLRNAVAIAVNPATQQVWALPNGSDGLEHGHPYEIGDAITAHGEIADYGWPHCYENRRKADPKADCSKVIIPTVALPAYNAPIGAVIYPLKATGKYAFPKEYAGGLFVGLHGSWHVPLVPPRVAFVALNKDTPKTPVNWDDPTTQWQEFFGGFQAADGTRSGRPTGVAVGNDGSLFVADDFANVIYRIRYSK